jgi:chromosome segregation ATPase
MEEVRSMEHMGMSESMPSFLKDEVAPILAAAERAAAQIVERAREQARQETEDLERTRQRVESRVSELVSWQEQVEPSIRSLQSKVADIQAKIEEVPELIRKALDPVATAISSLDPTLAEVSAASRPVLNMESVTAEPTSDEAGEL